MNLSWRALCFVLLFAIVEPSFAHKPSDSYLTVTQGRSPVALDVRWDIALRDLNQAIGLDVNANGEITWGELRGRTAAVTQYAVSRLEIEGGARGQHASCPLDFRQIQFDEHVDGGYAVLRFSAACPFPASQLTVRYGLLFDIDPNHRGLVDVVYRSSNNARVLSKEHPSATLDMIAPAGRAQQVRAFLGEGIWHIWHGYDHILFLLTLLLPAVVTYRNGRWEARASLREALLDVTKVVTAFTVAHSITLSLAVNGVISLPSRLVESAIALTVLLGALNNLFPVVRERRWAVAFAFGLIHGLGFASVLNDFGLQHWQLGLALIGFNLGVEAGQLAIVLVLVPLAYRARTTRFYRLAFMPAGAVAISCLALYWLAARASGIA